MIYLRDTAPHARRETDGEGQQRKLSLLRCLRRMGYYDPESLLGLRRADGSVAVDADADDDVLERLPL